MVQGLRLGLPVQGTWVQFLVRGDATEQLSQCAATTDTRLPRARALQWERPPHALQLERACVQQRGLSAALSVF